MKTLFQLLVCLGMTILTLAPGTAFGSSGCTSEDYKAQALAILSEIQSKGAQEIDGKPIQFITQEIQKMQFQPTARVVRKSELYGTERQSARYSKNSPVIEFDSTHCELSKPLDRGLMGLHEAFGKLGIRDNNFSRTGSIYTFLNYHQTKEKRPSLIQNSEMEKRLRSQIEKFRGGSTGVDGGGDDRILSYVQLIQIQLYMNYLRSPEEGTRDMSGQLFQQLSDRIAEYNIEFSDSIPQGALQVVLEPLTLVIPQDPMASPERIALNQGAVQEFLNYLTARIQHGQ